MSSDQQLWIYLGDQSTVTFLVDGERRSVAPGAWARIDPDLTEIIINGATVIRTSLPGLEPCTKCGLSMDVCLSQHRPCSEEGGQKQPARAVIEGVVENREDHFVWTMIDDEHFTDWLDEHGFDGKRVRITVECIEHGLEACGTCHGEKWIDNGGMMRCPDCHEERLSPCDCPPFDHRGDCPKVREALQRNQAREDGLGALGMGSRTQTPIASTNEYPDGGLKACTYCKTPGAVIGLHNCCRERSSGDGLES